MGLNHYHGYSSRRACIIFLSNIIFSTIVKVKVINTPVFFFNIKNPVLGNNLKIHRTIMGPNSRGILKSSRRKA